MKRHVQKTGIRQWAGDDLVELQAEPLKVLDAYFGEYGPSIIRGCEVTVNGNACNISSGIVAIGGADHEGAPTFKVVPFAGVEGITLPVYLTLSHTVIERAYTDRNVKPVAYDYRVAASAIKPADGTPYIEINPSGSLRFVDAIGLSRKLDKTGNGKDVTVTFAQAAERANVASGEKLSSLWSKVSRFFADLKTVAFTGKAADLTEDSTHRLFTDAERTKLNGVEANANNYTHPATHSVDMLTESAAKVVMTKPERDKLAGIEAGANAYTHPATHPAGMITEDASRRFSTDTEKQNWNSKAAGDHNHNTVYSDINHNHTGVYQPAGSYASASHGHTAAEIGAVPASASCNKNWVWSGQAGQPTWLWGGNDASNVYVWNPAEFSVRYAATAGSAPASDVPAWAKAPAKPAYTAAEVGAATGDHTHTADTVSETASRLFLTPAERVIITAQGIQIGNKASYNDYTETGRFYVFDVPEGPNWEMPAYFVLLEVEKIPNGGIYQTARSGYWDGSPTESIGGRGSIETYTRAWVGPNDAQTARGWTTWRMVGTKGTIETTPLPTVKPEIQVGDKANYNDYTTSGKYTVDNGTTNGPGWTSPSFAALLEVEAMPSGSIWQTAKYAYTPLAYPAGGTTVLSESVCIYTRCFYRDASDMGKWTAWKCIYPSSTTSTTPTTTPVEPTDPPTEKPTTTPGGTVTTNPTTTTTP